MFQQQQHQQQSVSTPHFQVVCTHFPVLWFRDPSTREILHHVRLQVPEQLLFRNGSIPLTSATRDSVWTVPHNGAVYVDPLNPSRRAESLQFNLSVVGHAQSAWWVNFRQGHSAIPYFFDDNWLPWGMRSQAVKLPAAKSPIAESAGFFKAQLPDTGDGLIPAQPIELMRLTYRQPMPMSVIPVSKEPPFTDSLILIGDPKDMSHGWHHGLGDKKPKGGFGGGGWHG